MVNKTPKQFLSSLMSKKLLTTLIGCITAYTNIPDPTQRWQTIAGLIVAYVIAQGYVDGQAVATPIIGPAITNANIAPTVHDVTPTGGA